MRALSASSASRRFRLVDKGRAQALTAMGLLYPKMADIQPSPGRAAIQPADHTAAAPDRAWQMGEDAERLPVFRVSLLAVETAEPNRNCAAAFVVVALAGN